MISELRNFLDQERRKNQTTLTDIYIINAIMKKLLGQNKMVGKIYEEGIQISIDDQLNGNFSEYDNQIFRMLNLKIYNDCLLLEIHIVFVQPHQEILSFQTKIDTIYNYLISNLNLNLQSKGISFYTNMDQIMAKYNIYLPKASDLRNQPEQKLNQLLNNIEQTHAIMEQSIMSYRDQLLSALDLDNQSISKHFQIHYALFEQYMNDNWEIEVDRNYRLESVIARKCEIYQGQLFINGVFLRNIQNLSNSDQEILNNLNNIIIQQLNYDVKFYHVEIRVDPINQNNNNNIIQILEGELLQEFQRNIITQDIQIPFQNTSCSFYIPEADPKQKNILQKQLPNIQISVVKKLLILKEVIFTIRENQILLNNPNFSGILSILKMVRFCNVLGSRPIFIMEKKDRNQINLNLILEENVKIIQQLVYVLFFQDCQGKKMKPIDNLCREYLINLQNISLQDFNDIDKKLLKLEKLIVLVKSIYCMRL